MLAPAQKRARLYRAPWTGGRVATLAVAAALLYSAVSTPRLIAAGAAPSRHKHDRFLQQTTASRVRVIVRTRPGQLASVRDRLRQQGRTILHESAFISAVTTVVGQSDLDGFDSDDAVLNVSLDAP